MNESFDSVPQRPSIFGSFVKGAMSSALSGAMMAGIVALVGPLFGAAALGWGGALLMFTATGLFGGMMGVKRAIFDVPSASSGESGLIPVPVTGATASVSVPSVSADLAAEQDRPSKNWVSETGRDTEARNRIQQILANGSMNDKDRASAILAAREASTASEPTRGA